MKEYAMTSEVIPVADSIGTIEKIMSSSLLNWVALGILLYLSVLWIAIILWVTKDITNRTNNVALQIVCISLVIFLTPIFGLVIYLIVRPSKTLIEKYYEEFEMDMINEEEHFKEVEHCPFCAAKTSSGFHFCSFCAKEIVRDCKGCKKSVRVNWSACPYCGEAQENIVDFKGESEVEVKKSKKKASLKPVKAKEIKEDSKDPQTSEAE